MRSMTGFASVDGAAPTETGRESDEALGEIRWRWDARSVNNRGLELRLRTPPAWDAREGAWRAAVAERFKRGSISLSLTVTEGAQRRPLSINRSALEQVLAEATDIRRRIRASGAPEPSLSIDGLLALRGVLEADAPAPSASISPALQQEVDQGLAEVLDRLAAARAEEGARLQAVLSGQVDEIARLTERAAAQADARGAGAKERLAARVAALTEAGAEVDPARLAQELALIAVKLDVSEEIDRLRSHVAGARALLSAAEPVGRKLDFLTQEFNREANTLCSKAQDAALTEIGLSLKVVIDQLREQTSNVE